MEPVRWMLKGRGAVSSPAGRFEPDRREPVDDGWGAAESGYDDEGPHTAPGTSVTEEPARSLITRNQSPDIGFDASINPYRGCEHVM